jgi:uncharacterized membrane protein YdbT with pleckstrin-like domain
MSYVDQNLASGEQVLLRAKMHWAIALRWFVVAVICLAIQPLRPLGVLVLIIGGAMLALHRAMNEYAVTNKRVIIKSGIISRQTLELNLPKVESIGVTQPILGRIFGYGNITVRGTGGTAGTFKFVSDPLGFRKIVSEATERLQASPPHTALNVAARA